ncbi:MAG TPA: c-type cytochrome domain-containing protein [Bacteroidota bacterium]|nr:c-type cytochrome domain-containing protein [Bacteroidota bacterium]
MKIITFALLSFVTLAFLPGCSNSTDPDNGGNNGGGEKSFRQNVLPILNANGCSGCHGGNGGLTVTSVGALLTGGDHGPAIVPGNADSSNLVRKLLSPPPFGSRMPLGGGALSDASVGVIRTWINEGAKDN